MGCFNFTCSITRTAIKMGEKVLLVVANPNNVITNSTNWLETEIRYYAQSKLNENFKPHIYVGVGEYDDYGWVNNCPLGDRDIIQDFKVEKDLKLNQEPLDYYFMCHLEIVEEVLNIKLEDGELKQPVELLQKLCDYAHNSRTELFLGYNPAGEQGEDDDEIRLKLKQLEITRNILERHLKEYHIASQD